MIRLIKKLIHRIFNKRLHTEEAELTYLDIYENYNDDTETIENTINTEFENTNIYIKSNIMNLEKLNGIIPAAVLNEIPSVSQKFEINTSLRLAHFLAQCGHESGGFRLITENLNYSAQGLANTWPNRFAVDRNVKPLIPNQLATTIQRNAEKIANIVYANRMSNGDEASGDGFKFRGRGYIQLTGRANYTEFNRFVEGDDVVANPDLVATKYPLLSAGWFFNSNGIHRIADAGESRATVEAVTRRVNGGLIGIEDRVSHFNKYYDLLK
jgi:putative chitinase